MKIFVSYSFVGRIDNQYYNGFGNIILNRPSLPFDEESLEYFQNTLNAKAKDEHGMDSIIATMLWYNVLKA